MRTVVVSRFGGPEVLQPRDAPGPRPGPGQVAIDVEVVEVPDGLDLGVALAALHDGVLALDRLDRSGLRPGSRVLVTAAAGSVGQWVVPLAAAAGAEVTAAVGSPAKAEAVRTRGAARVVVHRIDGWVDDAGPFDVVFDGSGGAIGRSALARTVDGGLFHAYGAASGEFGADRGERGVTVLGVRQEIDDRRWRDLVRRGLDLLVTGRVHPVVGQRVPLEEAARAHAAIARREVVGKTVLTVRTPGDDMVHPRFT
jgi:NADPH2:quinone reductase